MLTIGVYEAKTRLSDLLGRVDNGETITITRHGRPVAALVPISQVQQPDIAVTIRKVKEFGLGRSLGTSIGEAREDGRQ
jgi:prevent-host-death family protein